MNKLTPTDIEFLETAKQEGFRAWKGHVNASSGHFEFGFETPGGAIFTQDEITLRFCQGCEDDENEGIEVIDCICTKEQYRSKVRKILDILETNHEEGLAIMDKE